MPDLAGKPPGDHQEAHRPAGAGQIRDLSGVAAMNSARHRAAQRAPGRHRCRPNGQNNRVRLITYTLNRQPTRYKGRNSKSGPHGADSPIGEPQARQRISSKVSQSQNCTPKHTKFPANREINREFLRIRSICEILKANTQVNSKASGTIPYAVEQGIILAEQGFCTREQGKLIAGEGFRYPFRLDRSDEISLF